MAGYTLEFKAGTNIWDLYQALKEDGVKNSQLDRGYYIVDYINEKHVIVHKKDKVIQEEEVLDYALERYDKYRELIQEKMGYKIPWLLDDFNPDTTFDEEIRKKIEDAIPFIKNELKKEGYKPKEDAYKILLAIFIFNFVTADDVDYPKYGTLNELKEINDYFNLQGKDVVPFPNKTEDCQVEATALESLYLKCGACTEGSAIAYSALKMAGLNVSFIEYPRHASIGLILHGAIFDLRSAPPFYKYRSRYQVRISLREFLSIYYSNLGDSYKEQGKFDKAIAAEERALEINPNNSGAHHALASIYSDKGEFDKALDEMKSAFEIDPKDMLFYFNFGVIKYELGKKLVMDHEYEKAEGTFKEAKVEFQKFLETISDDTEALKYIDLIEIELSKDYMHDNPE